MLRLLFLSFRFLCPLLAVWVLFYPTPYWTSIGLGLLMIPLTLVLASMARTDFTVQEPPQKAASTKTNLAGPFVLLTAALFLRTLFDFNFPDRGLLLLWVSCTGFALGLALWVVAPAANLMLALLIGFIYAYPLLAAANSIGSSTPVQVIEAKYVKGNTYSKPHFRTLVVSAEGRDHEFVVQKGTYSAFPISQPLCIAVRTGLLGIREFKLSACTQ